MRFSVILAIVFTRLSMGASGHPTKCPTVPSCSKDSTHDRVDPCCRPSPGGLFVLRQRLQLDEADDSGNWGIDGLDVLECDSLETIKNDASSPLHTHAEITSLCLKSPLFGEEGVARAEKDWAYTEAGESVDELWERSWGASGRYISTLSPHCLSGGETTGVPAYFHALQRLHNRFNPSKLLADNDITPSPDTTYSLSEIEASLSPDNSTVIVTCVNGALSSISRPLIVQGKFQDGKFLPYDGDTTKLGTSNCPAEGIKYPSSVIAPTPKPSDKWDPIFRPQPRAITKSHDEAKLYHTPSSESTEPAKKLPTKLGFFKGKDEKREVQEDRLAKQFARDELRDISQRNEKLDK